MKDSFRRVTIRTKYFVKENLHKLKTFIKYGREKIELNESKKIYIFLAADYGNIGDVAITYAQKKFIESIARKYEVIEVQFKKNLRYISKLKNKIGKDDIITIVGGGNLTNRYDAIEEARRMVIKNFPNNIIISFPQTIEFTDDIEGQESLRRTKKIYSKHRNLHIFAREPRSYKFMKEIFDRNNVYLVPDIVMSLKNKVNLDIHRTNKIGICLRNDKEKNIKIDVNKIIEKNYPRDRLEYITTHIGDKNFTYEDREKHLFDLLKKIKEKKVFVTDRLHGMIFCYLTETPCIVFDNDNHKILESYKKWLKDCNYIKLLDEKDAISINEHIKSMENIKIKDINLENKFDTLKNIIIENFK